MAESLLQDRPPARGAVRRAVSSVLGDSLYRNSTFLMLNSVLVATLGMLFWTIAARWFTAAAVGTVTTVISGVTYAGMVGTLGLPNTVIAFYARERDPVRLLATAGAIALVAGGLVGLLWSAVPGHLGIPLGGVTAGWSTGPLVVAVVALASFGAVAEAAIIATRASKWVVVENGIASLVKLAAVPLVVGLGASGLFGLFVASLLASAAASAVVVVRLVGEPPGRWVRSVDVRAVAHVRTFAAGNHVAALVSMLPGTVVRIVVLTQLGARAAAFLAMPLMVVALLKVIPSTASQSLFAEAAADEGSLRRHAARALTGIYAVLVPAVAALVVLARPILSVFGTEYADAGTRCLQLLALSGLFAGFNYVADTILNAGRRVRAYVFVNVVGSVAAIAFPVALVGRGLTGVGLGWLLGQLGYGIVALATLGWSRGRSAAMPRSSA